MRRLKCDTCKQLFNSEFTSKGCRTCDECKRKIRESTPYKLQFESKGASINLPPNLCGMYGIESGTQFTITCDEKKNIILKNVKDKSKTLEAGTDIPREG